MKTSTNPTSQTASALESIDIEAIRERRSVDAATLLNCVRTDIANRLPILLPIMLKYVPRNLRLTPADLVTMKLILKEGVLGAIDDSPELAITYLKSLELCVAELRARP